MMAMKRSHGRQLTLRIISIVLSLASLATLAFDPAPTGSLRPVLNVVAIFLLILAMTMLRGSSRGGHAANGGAAERKRAPRSTAPAFVSARTGFPALPALTRYCSRTI
jgi:hypothetical protein